MLVKGTNCVARTFFHCTIRSWRRKVKKLVVGSALCLEDKLCISLALLLSLLFSRPMFQDFSVKRYIGTFTAFLCALLLPMDLRTDVGVLLTDPTTAAHRHLAQRLCTQAGCLVHFRRIPLQFKRERMHVLCTLSGHCFTLSFPLH